ncbi:alkaline phosphatase family protein [Cytobacillus kochii]|uniref:alkaline phosphatase family protein n=1 Tax=Cytobacillus kochii TaxID=859143 RepID=UPI001CD31015|nr:alkaline phosphatase family protein [Cytobacillus kochii]MCA1028631.1 alkaline phosphatase family protein [Cytobacillus kochii]
MKSKFNKVLIIGLDSAEPSLIYNEWLKELPAFREILQKGIYSKLKSTIPPITVPAWMSMMTGKTPGELGVYGFRNKVDRGEGILKTIDSYDVQHRKIWDIIALEGKKSIINGVPLTFPIKKINGNIVSCFMTPSQESNFTHPKLLKDELISNFGNIQFDIKGFRRLEKDELIDEIRSYTEQQFDITDYLTNNKEWDFAAMVEMGTDRIQHAFWNYMDENHVLFEPNSPHKNVIFNHYKYLDSRVAKLINNVPDNTLIMIVSDHGAKRMEGGFCFNEWLIEKEYLVLKNYPKEITPFEELNIDWVKTRAYSFGGYYGRLFINKSYLTKEQQTSLMLEIKSEIEKIKFTENKECMNNKVYLPSHIYPKVNNYPPEGIVYFNNLYWRAISSVGHRGNFIRNNDTGPDGSNHSQEGIFMCIHKKNNKLIKPQAIQDHIKEISIYDIVPTLIDVFDIKYSDNFIGKSIFRKV